VREPVALRAGWTADIAPDREVDLRSPAGAARTPAPLPGAAPPGVLARAFASLTRAARTPGELRAGSSDCESARVPTVARRAPEIVLPVRVRTRAGASSVSSAGPPPRSEPPPRSSMPYCAFGSPEAIWRSPHRGQAVAFGDWARPQRAQDFPLLTLAPSLWNLPAIFEHQQRSCGFIAARDALRGGGIGAQVVGFVPRASSRRSR
jgi:hypothetical protein